ncbi:hypothetical protein D7V97_15685 [Corallococcus sp. CA053C]|nr:hypothetical protein D7V97_15685 [Corallococcus sp. CA053C]
MDATAGGRGFAVGFGTGLSLRAEQVAAAAPASVEASAPASTDEPASTLSATGVAGVVGRPAPALDGLATGGVRGASVQARQVARRQAHRREARLMPPV